MIDEEKANENIVVHDTNPTHDKLNGGEDNNSVSDAGDDSLKHIMLDIDSGEINELAVVAEGEERTTWFVWILVMCSTISGLLFGSSVIRLRWDQLLNFVLSSRIRHGGYLWCTCYDRL